VLLLKTELRRSSGWEFAPAREVAVFRGGIESEPFTLTLLVVL
jgi:hypothetical protein